AAAVTISFAVPSAVAPGSYEFRLLSSYSLTLLATSSPVTVTAGSAPAGPTTSAASASFAAGSSVNVSWSGIASPTAADWIAIVAVGAATTTRPAWQYTTGAAAGTISFAVPSAVAPGSYEFRLLANNSL